MQVKASFMYLQWLDYLCILYLVSSSLSCKSMPRSSSLYSHMGSSTSLSIILSTSSAVYMSYTLPRTPDIDPEAMTRKYRWVRSTVMSRQRRAVSTLVRFSGAEKQCSGKWKYHKHAILKAPVRCACFRARTCGWPLPPFYISPVICRFHVGSMSRTSAFISRLENCLDFACNSKPVVMYRFTVVSTL